MSKETIEVELDGETIAKLQRMTKDQLIEKLALAALEAKTYRLRCETAIETEREALAQVEKLERKLEKERAKLAMAESYVEQGRVMVEAIMERWYDYSM